MVLLTKRESSETKHPFKRPGIVVVLKGCCGEGGIRTPGTVSRTTV